MPSDSARTQQLLLAAKCALGAIGIGIGAVLANSLRNCGDEGEACMAPGAAYLVLGIPAYVLGIATFVRVAVERVEVPSSRFGVVVAIIAVGAAGLYALTFLFAAHS